MIMLKRVFFVCILILSGCTERISQEEIEAIQTSTVFNVNVDKLWDFLVIAITDDMGLPVTTIEKESKLLVTDFVSIPYERLAEISMTQKDMTISSLVFSQGRYKLNCLVRKVDSTKTSLKILAHIEGRYSLMDTREWYVCKTRGRIEKEIFDAIQNKLIK